MGVDDDLAHEISAPLDENITESLRTLLAYQPGDAFLGVPVIAHDKLCGILAAKVREAGALVGDEEGLLTALADQAAIALSHAAEYRRAERKASERAAELRSALERHAAELEEANEAKDLFFNALSHELRTPIATIENAVRLLRRGHDDSDRILTLLERNIDRLVRLIDDILDLSRLMRRRIVLDRQPLRVKTLLSELVEPWRHRAEDADIELDFEPPPESLTVEGDRDRLGQVMDNLLSNAIKFTQPGGKVSVRARAEGSDAVISVADTGAGIEPEALSRIFEPFRPYDESHASPARTGLGIGLSIAHSLVAQHGGRLAAASAGAGQGSEFTVRLPRDARAFAGTAQSGDMGAVEDAEGAAAAGDPASPPGEPRGAPRRVLLVEDSEDLRESMAQLIGRQGHDVIAASEGSHALEVAARARPDIIVIDIGLPDMNGYDLARTIRRMPGLEATRLIALTGYAGEEARQRARDSGFDLHLAKPTDVPTLERLLLD